MLKKNQNDHHYKRGQ